MPDVEAFELIAGDVARAASAAPRSSPLATTARRLLLEAVPGARILGAELSAGALPTRLVWISESFPEDGPEGIVLAATIDGVVVAAAVVDLRMGISYSAHRGGGARQDGQHITPARVTHLADATIGEGDVPAEMLCRVAGGSLAGCVHHGPVSAPTLAAAHIAEEAGALVELPCPENADLLLAATPRIFEALREAVAPSASDAGPRPRAR